MGYIYFQDFVPDNTFDTRLVVVGNRCFGMRRYCRDDDFRASGSGMLDYDHNKINIEMVKIAFQSSKTLKTQSAAFDFVVDKNQPKIIEVSYCFVMGESYDNCEGYWDEDLRWHDESVDPQRFMIDDFVELLPG